MTGPEVIRPALTKDETELIMEALDELSLQSRYMEKMEACRDVKVRLAAAAMRKGWRIED